MRIFLFKSTNNFSIFWNFLTTFTKKTMPRILAIDFGIKRSGIAVTDELQIIASGLTTIPSETVINFLKDYFSKENVIKVLIGEPKQMNGQPSESAEIIEKFVTKFQTTFPNINVTRVIVCQN